MGLQLGSEPVRKRFFSTRRVLAWSLTMAVAVLSTLGACATAGSTLGSGVGDAHLERPPYYAGARLFGTGEAAGHLPIVFQRGATQAEIFDPTDAPGTPLAQLLADMNLFVDSIRGMAALEVAAGGRTTPPDVRFGCDPFGLDECRVSGPAEDVVGKRTMRLTVGRPSQSWVAAIQSPMASTGQDRLLVITLEVGQYWIHQKNLLGSKEVRLGTGYTPSLPWLTSLEQPVQVLQLTGALVDREGRAIRIGAEGLVARRTNIILSGLGAQELITDDDVQRIRSARRDDLQGQPLVWHVAMTNLVAQLTGDARLAVR